MGTASKSFAHLLQKCGLQLLHQLGSGALAHQLLAMSGKFHRQQKRKRFGDQALVLPAEWVRQVGAACAAAASAAQPVYGRKML